jgi:Integrase core domain
MPAANVGTPCRLHFITSGRPTENGFIESFNGKFRDECLNENWFLDLADAREKIETGDATTSHSLDGGEKLVTTAVLENSNPEKISLSVD